MVRVQDTEILRGVQDQWKAAIDAQEPERVADVFTEDAIFQGLHPYRIGAKASPITTPPNHTALRSPTGYCETRRPVMIWYWATSAHSSLFTSGRR
jgi:hypothetical protein